MMVTPMRPKKPVPVELAKPTGQTVTPINKEKAPTMLGAESMISNPVKKSKKFSAYASRMGAGPGMI